MKHDVPPVLDRIVENPPIMAGKPVIKGTRVPVERVLAHLARNPDLPDLFAAYPELTADDARASLAYAAEIMERQHPRTRRHAREQPAHTRA